MRTNAELVESSGRSIRVFTYGNAVGVGLEINDEEGKRAFDLSVGQAESLAHWLLAAVVCSKAGRTQ